MMSATFSVNKNKGLVEINITSNEIDRIYLIKEVKRYLYDKGFKNVEVFHKGEKYESFNHRLSRYVK